MNLVVPMLLLICIISTVLPAVHAHVHNCVSHEVYKDFQEERVGQAYHSERLRSSRDYIRVLADTSLVTGSDALSCRSVGAYVRIGSPGTASPNPVCTTANGYINCWHSCSEEDVLTPSKRDLIDDVLMGGAIDLIKSFLKVTPVQGNLVLSSGVCGANGGFAVPTTYTTTGAANTDLVLFVTARPTNGKLLAYALECRADQHGRPIAGQVNIAPAALEDSAQARNYIRVVLHEIVHVLGFTSWKYSSFVDPNTNVPLASVTKSATGPQGGAITQVVTPNALYHAQQFFGCSSLGGVSLEDGGSAASALSHWEKRIFRDDLMSPSMEDDVYISNTTLGFLADMGWYDVDYSVAEVSQWGLRQGCQFPTGKCTEWTQPYTSCSVASTRTCSHSRRAVSYCAIADYDGDLPAEYQWFVNPRSGGLDEFVDYCPIYVPYSDYDCRGTNPFVTTNRIQRGAEVGPNSFCFESSLLNKSYTGGSLLANCFNTQCQSGVLQVIIAGIPYNCPINGGDITSVTYFNGAITCPPADVVCGSSTLLPTPTPTISPTPPPATTPPTVAPPPTPTTVPTTKPPTNPPATPTPTTPPTTIIPPTNPPTTPIPTTPPTTITPPTTPPPTTVPPTKPPTKQPTTPPTPTPTATLQPTTPTTATAQPTTPPTKPASTTSATIATTSSTTAVGSTTTSSTTTTTTGVDDKADVGIIMYLRTTKPCSLVDNSDLQKSISSYLGVALSQVQVTDCGLGGKEFTLAVSVVLHGNSSISGTVLGQCMENAMSNSVFASDLLSQEYELESVSYFNYTPTTTTTTSTTASSSTTSKPATTTSATSASTTTSSSSQGTNIQQQVADVFSGDNLIIIPCAIGGGLLVIAIIIIIVVKKKKKSGGGGGGKDQWY